MSVPVPFSVGVVESVGGHSDSEDDEEGHEHVPLERGKARVSWYRRTDNPSTVNVSDLVVVDRSVSQSLIFRTLVENKRYHALTNPSYTFRALLHHDIVSLRSDPLGQTGFVTDVSLYCDVKCLKSGEITRNVKTCDLIPVQPLKRGTYVVHGHWLGKVCVSTRAPCLSLDKNLLGVATVARSSDMVRETSRCRPSGGILTHWCQLYPFTQDMVFLTTKKVTWPCCFRLTSATST